MCSLVERTKLVIFMRGTETKPECENSKEAIELLLHYRARFDVVNVNVDTNAEMAIREYTGDSRIPLVFLKGDLVGSTAEVKQWHENGVLETRLDQAKVKRRTS